MPRKERTSRASAKEIEAARKRGESRSNWEAAERITQTEVDQRADEDDGPLPEGWESTVEIGIPEPATPVHIRLDTPVLRWFKAQGPGYQTRINAVLRAYVRSRQQVPEPGTKGPPSNRKSRLAQAERR